MSAHTTMHAAQLSPLAIDPPPGLRAADLSDPAAFGRTLGRLLDAQTEIGEATGTASTGKQPSAVSPAPPAFRFAPTTQATGGIQNNLKGAGGAAAQRKASESAAANAVSSAEGNDPTTSRVDISHVAGPLVVQSPANVLEEANEPNSATSHVGADHAAPGEVVAATTFASDLSNMNPAAAADVPVARRKALRDGDDQTRGDPAGTANTTPRAQPHQQDNEAVEATLAATAASPATLTTEASQTGDRRVAPRSATTADPVSPTGLSNQPVPHGPAGWTRVPQDVDARSFAHTTATSAVSIAAQPAALPAPQSVTFSRGVGAETTEIGLRAASDPAREAHASATPRTEGATSSGTEARTTATDTTFPGVAATTTVDPASARSDPAPSDGAVSSADGLAAPLPRDPSRIAAVPVHPAPNVLDPSPVTAPGLIPVSPLASQPASAFSTPRIAVASSSDTRSNEVSGGETARTAAAALAPAASPHEVSAVLASSSATIPVAGPAEAAASTPGGKPSASRSVPRPLSDPVSSDRSTFGSPAGSDIDSRQSLAARAVVPDRASATSVPTGGADTPAPVARAGAEQPDAPGSERPSTQATAENPANPVVERSSSAHAAPADAATTPSATDPIVVGAPAGGAPVPASTASAATPAVPAVTPALPPGVASQVGRALAQAATRPGEVTIRLDPVELGRLQIQIVQPKDGPASVTLTAERPDTLQMLIGDQKELQRTLDQAGVATEGRAVTFHLAAAGSFAEPDRLGDPSSAAANRFMGQPVPVAADATPPSTGQMTSNDGGGQRFASGQGGGLPGSGRAFPPGGSADEQLARPAPAVARRAGIDITA